MAGNYKKISTRKKTVTQSGMSKISQKTFIINFNADKTSYENAHQRVVFK